MGTFGITRAAAGTFVFILVLATALRCGGTSAAPSAGSGPAAKVTATAATPPAVAAAPTAPPRVPPAEPDRIRLSYGQSMALAPFYLAIERGYLQEEGVMVDAEVQRGAGDVIAFLANGQLDVALGALGAGTFNAFAKGYDLRLVAPLAYYVPGDNTAPLVVRRDLIQNGAATRVPDFRERRVATNSPGAIGEYLMGQYLTKGGLQLADVDVTYLPFPDVPVAMANAAIDAAVVPEPWTTTLRERELVEIATSDMGRRTFGTGVLFGGKLLHERGDAGRRFIAAMLRATRDTQDRTQFLSPANLETFSRWTQTGEDMLRRISLNMFDPNLEIDLASIEHQRHFYAEQRRTTALDPIPPDRMVDNSFVDYALGRLGRVPARQ